MTHQQTGGERCAEDFLEVEATLGVELLFPNPPSSEGRPAFQEIKRRRVGTESPGESSPRVPPQ